VPRFELLLHDREQLAGEVAARAPRFVGRWSARSILAADEPEGSRLEVTELELPEGAGSGPGGEHGSGVLAELGQDLTERAERGMTGRIDGRDDLVKRVLDVLSGPGRSCVLLVGPREVGKTALLHEIAFRLAAGDVPQALHGRRLWRISANELISGAKYTGMWQERARTLIQEIRGGRVICAMDDPVPIIDAGRWSQSENNVSRFLRPYMESGDITILCESEPEQVAAAYKKEPSFIDAFHRIDIAEPAPGEVRQIVGAAASRLATARSTGVGDEAVDAAIELTRRYEPYRGFPGKAVRLVDDALRERSDVADALGREDVVREFARRTGLPLVLLADDVELDVTAVEEHFESRVLGQGDAAEAMVRLIAVLKAGLTAPEKPLGSFFFVGPTGVGKTELAKALAEFLFGSRDRVLRFDMGEYASGDAVAKLIGSGWHLDSEGELTRRIREQPFSVVLLDEIEKAHWSVFDALLAVLGEGRLTNAGGRTADFRNAIVIMTSNLGATRSRSGGVGFSTEPQDDRAQLRRHYVEQAEKFFRPEFFNRIDQIVVFQPLEEAVVRQIARRELGRLLMREGVVRRRLLVEVDDAVIDVLAREGFHPQYGARPLQRELERAVIQPLARLIVERNPAPGEVARIHLRAGEIAIDLQKVDEAVGPAPTARPRVERDEGTFAKALRAALDFEAHLESEGEAPIVNGLREERSSLVVETHAPDFWDDPDRAKQTLARVYQLEHVLDRFDSLARRAGGLSELARQVAQTRSRARLREVWAALAEMEDGLAASRLELAGAAAGDGKGAVVRVVPVGDDADDWASALLGMYCAWAERTARDVTRTGAGRMAQIDGPSTFDLLAGEEGLHRRVGPDRGSCLARVLVESTDEQPNGDAAPESNTVVRVYEDGRRRVVRDPRTGARQSHLNAVLVEGRIDPFLLAWLRRQRDQAAAVQGPPLSPRSS
jgi:ATP-dependent Clp protease ATP-binding subunit ClpA